MKYLFIIPCIISSLNCVSQTTFKFVGEDDLSLDYTKKKDCKAECTESSENDSVVLIQIYAVAPDAKDAEKQERIKEVDELLKELVSYRDCSNTHTIILQIGDALFLTKKDKLKAYSDKYDENGHRVNAENFWERYQERLKEWLPGKTVILCSWDW
ncbi:hypothetical protein JYT74_00605 [Crocinitomix catalasitica]|nr:hypothetical protein [Crocinitomix catalasitica]